MRAARPVTRSSPEIDGEAFEDSALRAAAAVELVHTASLVHDDLLDAAELRRGVPTIGAAAGRDAAVAAGDLLFSVAFATLVDCRDLVGGERTAHAVRLLASTARTLAEGEALQARQVRDPHIGVGAYLDRCAAKTGVLFGASLQLGAVLGGAAHDDVELLGSFGTLVGTAFQITDDVLDCGGVAGAGELGKLAGADLRDGTITLPMLHAMERDPSLAAALARPVPVEDVDALLRRIEATGGIERSREHALRLHEEATALLVQLGDRFEAQPLLEIARRSVHRLT